MSVTSESKIMVMDREFAGYRLYTKIGLNNGFVIVGVEVKSMGMNLEVNSIRTVFSRRRKGEHEEEIYRDPEITQEQSEFFGFTKNISSYYEKNLVMRRNGWR